MAESALPDPRAVSQHSSGRRTRFLIGGVVLLAAVVYLIATNLLLNQEYYIGVSDLLDPANAARYTDHNVRIAGVVIGDTIQYDGHTLSFEIANVPDMQSSSGSDTSLADALHRAASDPAARRLKVIVIDQPKPDLLKHEAQAIVAGRLGADGIFHADELLLKCPTRYDEKLAQPGS